MLYDRAVELGMDVDAPIPCFTKFAKLLLEIEYGRPLEGDFSAENHYGFQIIRKFYEAQKEFGDLSQESYLMAIDACLRFDKMYQEARRTAIGRLEPQEETAKKLIRANIVTNIVTDLPTFRQPRRKWPRR